MKLTKEMFEAGRSDAGGHNLKQLRALGLDMPVRGWPATGWPARLIGKEVSEAQYAEFLALRKKAKNVPQEETGILPLTQAEVAQSVQHARKALGAFPGDGNLESVKTKMDERAKMGFQKYGVTTERDDIDLLGWLIHLQEEQMDSLLYLEAAIRKVRGHIAGREYLKMMTPSEPDEDSPETYANQLFEKSGGDLSGEG